MQTIPSIDAPHLIQATAAAAGLAGAALAPLAPALALAPAAVLLAAVPVVHPVLPALLGLAAGLVLVARRRVAWSAPAVAAALLAGVLLAAAAPRQPALLAAGAWLLLPLCLLPAAAALRGRLADLPLLVGAALTALAAPPGDVPLSWGLLSLLSVLRVRRSGTSAPLRLAAAALLAIVAVFLAAGGHRVLAGALAGLGAYALLEARVRAAGRPDPFPWLAALLPVALLLGAPAPDPRTGLACLACLGLLVACTLGLADGRDAQFPAEARIAGAFALLWIGGSGRPLGPADLAWLLLIFTPAAGALLRPAVPPTPVMEARA